jgi:hypothetical protein
MGEKIPKEQRAGENKVQTEINNKIDETYGTVWATEE